MYIQEQHFYCFVFQFLTLGTFINNHEACRNVSQSMEDMALQYSNSNNRKCVSNILDVFFFKSN